MPRTVFPTLAQLGPRKVGAYPFLPMFAGIPEGVSQRVHVVNWNNLESVEKVMSAVPIACVVTKPVLQNIGVVSPATGNLQ